MQVTHIRLVVDGDTMARYRALGVTHGQIYEAGLEALENDIAEEQVEEDELEEVDFDR